MSVLASRTLKFKNTSGAEVVQEFSPERRNVDGIVYVCRNGNAGNPDQWSSIQTSVRLPTKTSPVTASRTKLIQPFQEQLAPGTPASVVPRSAPATFSGQSFVPKFLNDTQRLDYFSQVVAVIADQVFGKEPHAEGRTAV